MHRRVNGSRASELENIKQARRSLPKVESRLDGFIQRMNELVGKKTSDLRRSVRNEKKMLDRLEKQLDQQIAQARKVTAGAAYASFVSVKGEFDQIIMRGDVGLLDVAWRKKEDMSQRINQLFEDRTAELKNLSESFEEIR